MTRIKLCGCTRKEDIETVNRLMPEYIGLVFFKNSRRFLSFAEAAELKKLLHPAICAVGVFVDEDINVVAEQIQKGVIDIAQLHGREDAAYIRKIKALTGTPVIKAFQIKSREDISRAGDSEADYILLDAGMGEGETFDWKWIQDIRKPVFLAGGLDAANVRNAIKVVKPFAVDVSSGIETDGMKDPDKMRRFCAAVRRKE